MVAPGTNGRGRNRQRKAKKLEQGQGSRSQSGTVLVTGGSGFVGGWCLVELLRRGYEVRATVRDLGREPEVRARLASAVEADDRLSLFEADLGDDAGWAEAATGCDYVLHVASPLPASQPKDPDELIVPARDGTLRVLRAGLDAGVERVVVTSSVAAVRNSAGPPKSRPLTEDDWSDPSRRDLSPYTRSKTIAERAAWELVQERGETEKLAVVNPGAIIGPVLSEDRSYSLQAVERMLNGMPGVPHLGFSFVDVRDVADLQLAAMAAPEAAGQRYIATAQFLWMAQVAEILRDRLGSAAAKVPRRTVPNFVVRLMARFDSELRSVVGDLGRHTEYSAQKAKTDLGWSPRPVEESIVDCARSLIDHGLAGAQAA
jgi:dihydroflavonol-4-reductase